jgi:hypothetical protein
MVRTCYVSNSKSADVLNQDDEKQHPELHRSRRIQMPVLDEVINHATPSANQTNLRLFVENRYDADLALVDREQLEAEDKLGCARGVLWSLIFEAALVAAAVLVWKCLFFSH